MTSIRGKVDCQKKPKVENTGIAGVKEHDITVAVEEMLGYLGVAYIRIPDAVYKGIFGNQYTKPYLKKLISKFLKGLPDFTLLFKSGKYACIELKTKTGKMSQGQKTFEKLVGSDNFHLCRSVRDVQEILREHGEIK